MRILLAVGCLFLLGACSSIPNPVVYHVEPTPIQKNQSKYRIADLKVNLTSDYWTEENNDTFATAEELQQQFQSFLEKHLAEAGRLAADDSDGFGVKLEIDYFRTFNIGGKALNKPRISHHLMVEENGTSLVSTKRTNYTTKYAYLTEAAVNIEISAFQWDEEDEPRDIELVATQIAKELINLGV